MTRYARGKAALVSVPIMVVVTILPVWVGINYLADLIDGPYTAVVGQDIEQHLILPHTNVILPPSP